LAHLFGNFGDRESSLTIIAIGRLPIKSMALRASHAHHLQCYVTIVQ
jgi:hypothetical protein